MPFFPKQTQSDITHTCVHAHDQVHRQDTLKQITFTAPVNIGCNVNTMCQNVLTKEDFTF